MPSSTTMTLTHFWDCNGMGCDSTRLQPWNLDKYAAPATYAPYKPTDQEKSLHGEDLWMVGAASDTLNDLLGSDVVGRDAQQEGGCGRCVLLRNPDAAQDWKVMVMKMNRCPPWSNGCEAGRYHMDLAAPGFDNLQYSTANVCGVRTASPTREASASCGTWYDAHSQTTDATGCCDALPDGALRKGCEHFQEWGWKNTGKPSNISFEVVDCPAAFVDRVRSSFDANGVV